MRAHEFVTERKKRKKRRAAAWGPGPYGGYGSAVGYSGDGGMGAGDGGGESIEQEGWKDWVAGATLGAAALGANAANYAEQPVEKGDTVYSIARQNATTPEVLYKLNKFNRDTKLKLGQMVKVPDTASDEKPEVKKSTANTAGKIKTITDSPLEKTLLNTARAAGIKGTELAAFMAQMAHESHDFQSLVEYGGSLDFRKYDPKYNPRKAKTLGNTKAGDGARYKGRGFVQLTGRYNYRIAGKALGLPLEQKPQLVEKPEIAAKVAIWYWQHRVQPKVDNFNDVKAVTKPINPSMRGLADRKDAFKDYMQVAMR
jgi:predicted chitinase